MPFLYFTRNILRFSYFWLPSCLMKLLLYIQRRSIVVWTTFHGSPSRSFGSISLQTKHFKQLVELLTNTQEDTKSFTGESIKHQRDISVYILFDTQLKSFGIVSDLWSCRSVFGLEILYITWFNPIWFMSILFVEILHISNIYLHQTFC